MKHTMRLFTRDVIYLCYRVELHGRNSSEKPLNGLNIGTMTLFTLVILFSKHFFYLLLQKPSFNSTCKAHSSCPSRRLAQWDCGNLAALLREARIIQDKLRFLTPNSLNEDRLAETFANVVLKEKLMLH